MRALALTIFLLATAAAQAGLTILQQVEGPGSTGQITIRLDGNKMRSDVAPSLSVIVDGDSGDSIFLNHDQRTFSRVTPEQARKLWQQMTNAQMKAAPGTLVATGEKKMIGSYNADLYTWNIGAMKMRLWTTQEFPNGPAIQAQLDRMQELGVNGVGATLMPAKGQVPGLRLRTEMEIQGQKLAYTILSVKEEPVEAAHFTTPSGYRETPFAVSAKPSE